MYMSKVQKHQNIKVIKSEEKPETPEILAKALIQISDAMIKLAGAGGLSNTAIAILIKGLPNCSHLAKDDILMVLENLPRLKSYYIRNK